MRFFTLFFLVAAGTMLTGNLLQAQSSFENQFFGGPELRQSGSYLGVGLADVDADRASALKLGEARGVEVTQVEEGSPAENAGLRAGDVLLSYNGENILGAQQLVRLVQETPQGRKIKIQFWRDGKMQTTTVVTGAPRAHAPGLPPGQVFRFEPRDFQNSPLFRNFAMPDIPNTLLVWKSSALGIECEPLGSQLAQYFGVKRGVLVRSVEKDSTAEKAGVRAGDVVTAVGDRTVANPRDLTSFLRTQHQPGRPLSLAIVRDHKALSLSVTPADNPE